MSTIKKIAIIGTPDYELLARYAGRDFIDLDIGSDAPLSLAERYIPKIYCAILRTVVSNTMHHRDTIDCIIAEVGEAKCDGARLVCTLLERELGLTVIRSKQQDKASTPNPAPLSDSDLPLADKLAMIMDSYIAKGLAVKGHQPAREYTVLSDEQFRVGFWGVPPNDFSLLKLFPRETKVLGWTRSVEARVPWSLDYEMRIPDTLPTVFFTQSFCQKSSLARYLATKHNGLYVDMDEKLSASTRAKLEAFLELSAGIKPWS
ncbi:MAG: hypothetical protein AUK32_00620 [Candidatus Aquicultor secundus]|uniref:hypothetical protein n=1 Tax=Candidatus Aquicultor secundus TaxID=1973895 RepID=UPI000916A675|nr:hypothetical protein [Candidatus Aquicultor secundus]NCO65345.1 hypothetical protein [Solirubrobacter sp.]OIO88800.1 MAG: hypothetical protein AUK32_00620 [Candidatus Aquicultor secundus]PIU26647.1 MAG: hypothetical protein COT10_07570 [Candidatus Aquicultor secundus]PIX52161.1 MAG: hypothetical protein COZ51_05775 [Candidatus Aquicultor secundus]PJB79043.1 MAG: hypothetical protein CO091_03130 [Candidatus Aquicultor secundus]